MMVALSQRAGQRNTFYKAGKREVRLLSLWTFWGLQELMCKIRKVLGLLAD
jgi:hypothetical protein